MVSSRCSLSLLFLFFFSRVSRGKKRVLRVKCVLMRIFVTCPFPPTPNKIFFNGEQQKRSRKPFHIAKESLFPFFSRSLSRLSFRSLSFSSRKAFVVVPFIKDLVAKRERCAVKLFQIRNSYAELGIIHTSAEPTARHPIYRLPTFRALLVQRYQFEWCRLRLFLRA